MVAKRRRRAYVCLDRAARHSQLSGFRLIFAGLPGSRRVGHRPGQRQSVAVRQNLEITTSVSLLIDFVLGVLIGLGHVFTPVASALLLTLILSLKSELSSFAGGLRPEEIRSAVLQVTRGHCP